MRDPASNQRNVGESVGEPPNKKIKLDPVAQQSECEVPASKVKIEALPDEVITKILSFFTLTELIDVAQNVCTKWRRASHNPLLWRNKEYCIDRHKSDAEVLTTLRLMPQLRSLVILPPVEEAVIHAVCDNCPHLTSLRLHYLEQISNSLLCRLVTSCQNIQTLLISAELLCDKDKANIWAQLHRLQSLHVRTRPHKTIYLAPFGNKCPELCKLCVDWKDNFCTEDLNQFIQAKCKTLTHLTLPWTVKGRCVVHLLTECTSLTCLALKEVHNNNVELLDAFKALSHLNNLRSLTLDFNYSGGEHLLAFAHSGLSHLQVLKIDELYLEDGAVAAICGSFTNLRELHLRYCRGLTDGDLKHLSRLSRLEVLCLNDCDELSGAALLHVSRIPNLRKLLLEENDLSKFKEGLEFIQNITSLEILSFAFSTNVDYFQLVRIPETLPKLRVLNVVLCELDKTLEKLKQKMPGLLVYAPLSLDCSAEMERLMKL